MFKKFYAGLITILLAIAVTITINYAWYVNGFDVDPLATGSSVDAYYHSGSGTSNDPYIITSPRHLYNLAWLQYLGTYNGKKVSNGKIPATYFKLGTTANGTLDMAGWPLPPIGTTENPFLGNFNGNGWKITNLTTTNTFLEFGNKHPSVVADASAFKQEKCSVIGFFGSIGSYNQSVLCETGYTATSYDTAANKVYNFYLNDNNVHTSFSTTLIGAVAGYVNATIEDVGVIQPHLNIQSTGATPITSKTNSNLSDFAVVGYAEEEYTTEKTKSSTIIYNPTYSYSHFNFKGMGSQADWGGSMNMKDMWTRIKNVNPVSGSTVSNYTTSEMQYSGFSHSAVKITSSKNTFTAYDSESSFGSYVKYGSNHSSTSGESYHYLTALYKDVIKVTKTNTIKNGFLISNTDESRFLNITSQRVNGTLNFNVSLNNNSTASKTWVYEDGKLFTYNEDDGYAYYLVVNSDLSLTISNKIALASDWGWDGDAFYSEIDSTNYYLKYFNNTWTLKNTYAISNGNSVYLTYNGTTIGSDTLLSNATALMFSNDGTNPCGTIMTSEGYYLRNSNGTFSLSTTSTTWSNDGYGLYNNGYYIQYNGTTWVLSRPLSFYISYNNGINDNYLTFDYNNGNPRFVNSTSKSNEALWTFQYNNGNPNGIISYIYDDGNGNQTTYYLYNNNGTLLISNSYNTSWSNDGYGLYNNGYYLQYNQSATNKWELSSDRGFYITAKENGVTHYLSISGTTITDQTSEANATLWKATSWTNNVPSGRISTYSGTTYLYYSNNSLLSGSTNYISWTNDNGKFKYENSYIQFFNGKWICGKLYYISDGTNYLTTIDNTNIVSTTSAQTLWVFSNNSTSSQPQGLIYTVLNGSLKYLRYSSSTLSLNQNNSTTWSNDGNGGIYSGTYYISLNDWNTGFKISYNSNYLNRNGTSNVTRGTDFGTATIWYTEEDTNYIYCIYDSTKYYLQYISGTSVAIAPNKSGILYYRNSNYIQLSGYSYSVVYYNGWNLYGSLYDVTWTKALKNLGDVQDYYEKIELKQIASKLALENKTQIVDYVMGIYREASTIYQYTREEGIVQPSVFNYIPLNASSTSPYTVENSNTGYIMSGAHGGTDSADIRISQYPISSINKDGIVNLNSNGYFVSFGTNKIRTVNASGIQYISDSNNSFKKYAASKTQLTNTLSNNGANNNSNIYGLHFMNAEISINHLVTAPYALINGTEYTNYQMPENCIDFNVASNGYINFFAGAYFQSNNSFFSLHQIIRNSEGTISEIKHISRIYKANESYGSGWQSADCVYLYEDNTWSNGVNVSGNSKYDLAFDKSWIETPGTYSDLGNGGSNDFQGYVFYFEIPVNKGEFALGSVKDRTGAYLFYLDIGANAAPVDRTEIKQNTTTTNDTLKYVNGIQILASGSTYSSDANSAVAIITAANVTSAAGNDIVISRSTNTITFSTSLISTYKDEGITLSGGTVTPVATSTTIQKVLRYVDYNRAEDKLYYTTIYNNGTTNTSYDCYSVDTSTGAMTEITDRTDQAEWGLLKIIDGSGTPTTNVTDSAFSFTTSTTTKILDFHTYILTSDLATLTKTVDMKIQEDTSSTKPVDGEYRFEHIYKLVGDSITMTPDELVVYIGPDLKASATVSGVTDHVATVTVTVGGTTYTFTFNASAIDSTGKTITIDYTTT